MWIKRLMHLVAYTIGFVMIVATWLSLQPLHEQIFRTGIVLYLSIIYIEFLDGSLFGKIKLSNIFEGKAKLEEIDDVDNLIRASRMSLYWIRLVQQSETADEREVNMMKLEQHHEVIKSMSLPKKYNKTQQELVQEVQELLLEFEKQ